MSTTLNLEGRRAILRAGGFSARTHVFQPPKATMMAAGANRANLVTAQISVTYNGFSDDAKKAFQFAVDIWAVSLNAAVTIRVDGIALRNLPKPAYSCGCKTSSIQ